MRNIIKERSVYFMIECYKRILYIAILETGELFLFMLCSLPVGNRDGGMVYGRDLMETGAAESI